jgi:outer membrane receptor protein involved in Fe transport
MKQLLLIVVFSLLTPAPLLAQDAVTGGGQDGNEDGSSAQPVAASEIAPPPERPSSEALATIPVPAAPEPPASAPAQADAPRQLDEVVVTAQKTKQSARKVPISVTALGGEFIQQTGAADLADVSLYVPNVRVDADDLGSPQVFIRGFGTNAFNPSFESSVGFVQDEIYFGRPGYFTESMFDIERVEVLRGPQGTLFGKNTIAGVFNVTSKGPESGLGADGRYFYGEDNEQRFEGGAGGMITDWFGARVAGLYRTQDGELYNQFLDRDEEKMTQKAGRLKLRLFSGLHFDSELTAAISETEAAFWPFQLMKLDDDTRNYLRGFDPNIEDDPLDFRTSMDTPGFIEKGSETIGLKTQWAIGDLGPLYNFNTVLVLGWSKFRIDQLNELDVSPADIARLDNHEDHEQKSVELRFTGSADSLFGLGEGLDFVAGGFYFDSDYTLLAQVMAGRDLGSWLLTDDFAQLLLEDGSAGTTGALGLPGLPILGAVTAPLTDGDLYRFDYVQNIESLALFGQATWYLTERWAVTPGVRLNKEKKTVDTRGASHCNLKDNLGIPLCVMEQILESQDYDYRGLTRDETDVSPKLALQYFAANDINYYASYTRGFKSGGFNSTSFTGTDLEFKPEKAQTYELGLKGRFFDRKLGFNLTLYKTDFKDLQVLAFNGVFFDVATADAKSQGLEADFTWITPYAPLRIAGSVGLIDAKYTHYPDAPAPISQGIGSTQDLSGKRIAFAPRTTGTLTPSLTYPFWGLLGMLAVDVIYQGDQYTDTDLDENTHVDAYTKLAARIILSNVTRTWSVSIGGSNLTDERVLNQVTDATFFPGAYFAQQASGRQLFAVVSLKI